MTTGIMLIVEVEEPPSFQMTEWAKKAVDDWNKDVWEPKGFPRGHMRLKALTVKDMKYSVAVDTQVEKGTPPT